MSSSVVLATASFDHTIKFWEVHSGKVSRTIKVAESQTNHLALSPDASRLAASCNPHIRLFDCMSSASAPLAVYEGHSGNVTQSGFQRDSKWLFSASEDGTVKIWDLRAPGCQREMENKGAVNTVVLHPNQAELVYGDQNGNLKVWDLKSNTCSRALVPGGEVAMRSISVAVNGKRIVAANNNGQCYVWRMNGSDTATFDPLTKLDAHSSYILSCEIAPSCKHMVTSSADNTCKIFDMKTFKHVKTLEGHDDWVWKACWSMDSAFIVSCSSDNSSRLWNAASGEQVRVYQGHQNIVSALALADKLEA